MYNVHILLSKLYLKYISCALFAQLLILDLAVSNVIFSNNNYQPGKVCVLRIVFQTHLKTRPCIVCLVLCNKTVEFFSRKTWLGGIVVSRRGSSRQNKLTGLGGGRGDRQ